MEGIADDSATIYWFYFLSAHACLDDWVAPPFDHIGGPFFARWQRQVQLVEPRVVRVQECRLATLCLQLAAQDMNSFCLYMLRL